MKNYIYKPEITHMIQYAIEFMRQSSSSVVNPRMEKIKNIMSCELLYSYANKTHPAEVKR